jgi:hypothetical protein
MYLSQAVRAFIWMVAIATFGVRLGGIHMHLCFDGQEPPASLHVEHEHGHDDYHHSDGSHQDQDVDLLAQAFFKKADLGELDIAGAVLEIVALLPIGDQLGPERLTTIQPTGPPHFVVPPLRGPPV